MDRSARRGNGRGFSGLPGLAQRRVDRQTRIVEIRAEAAISHILLVEQIGDVEFEGGVRLDLVGQRRIEDDDIAAGAGVFVGRKYSPI